MSTELTRRRLLRLVLCAAFMAQGGASHAKDGSDDGGGNSGSGNSGSGNSGSGNSGSGGGDDHDDDHDHDEDDNDDDGGNSGGGNSESQRAQDAVRTKKAVPLRILLAHLKANYPGKVLDVDLKRSGSAYRYRVKLLTPAGKLQRLRLDALTLEKI